MNKKRLSQDIQHLLANRGCEKTPAEAGGIVDNTMSLFEVVDDETYGHFLNMTPGKLLVEAMKEGCTIEHMMEIRNLIMYAYELKLGFEDPPFEHDLAPPSENL